MLGVVIVRCIKRTKGFMNTSIDRQVLLRTKFHRPRVIADLIDRPSLKARLIVQASDNGRPEARRLVSRIVGV